MAFQHAAIFFTLLLVWLVLINAQQSRRESRYPHVQSPQMRPTRGLDFKFYRDMDLGTARGYGKRSAASKPFVNNFLLEWIAFETRLRNLGLAKQLLNADDVLPE